MLRYEKRARRKGFRIIAGVDEAGRGPLAGPVVAASVILGKSFFYERIDDSKKLSPKKRQKAFFEILRSCLIAVGMVDNNEIDRINIRNATKRAMEMAVLGLGIKPDCLLIDGNMKLNLPFYQETIIRGDSKSISIAAASIVAKVVRDSAMSRFDGAYSRYGFRHHKGYGTQKHIAALKIFGPCPIHRRSFTFGGLARRKQKGLTPPCEITIGEKVSVPAIEKVSVPIRRKERRNEGSVGFGDSAES